MKAIFFLSIGHLVTGELLSSEVIGGSTLHCHLVVLAVVVDSLELPSNCADSAALSPATLAGGTELAAMADVGCWACMPLPSGCATLAASSSITIGIHSDLKMKRCYGEVCNRPCLPCYGREPRLCSGAEPSEGSSAAPYTCLGAVLAEVVVAAVRDGGGGGGGLSTVEPEAAANRSTPPTPHWWDPATDLWGPQSQRGGHADGLSESRHGLATFLDWGPPLDLSLQLDLFFFVFFYVFVFLYSV